MFKKKPPITALAIHKDSISPLKQNIYKDDYLRGIEIFGGNTNNSKEQLKEKFKRWSERNHPDRGGDLKRFQEASGAANSDNYYNSDRDLKDKGLKTRNIDNEFIRDVDNVKENLTQGGGLSIGSIVSNLAIHKTLSSKEKALRQAGYHDIADELRSAKRKHAIGAISGTAIGTLLAHKYDKKRNTGGWDTDLQNFLVDNTNEETKEELRKKYPVHVQNKRVARLMHGFAGGNAWFCRRKHVGRCNWGCTWK